MSKKIIIDWSESLIIDGKLFPKDRLNRAKYADFLTGYLSSQGFDPSRKDEEKRNYVINLNSGWGAGKTFFLKIWESDLANNYPVVYVDAWEKDYSDDPLMTVFSAIISSLRKQSGKDSDLIKVPPKILGLLKAAAPGLA
ncbi:P-loop NTPase fold protein [Pseudoalteromonas sp. NEC-BIFX-2020_002]|uniref:P-loop NTPase fold protein n=1 Tax=Pseudoalteromonas sp. NEC-BIFX-2020_002 TaxID=2732353 RepID=UPI0020179AE6|nr:P-loop NTPase fold protein [Pseudoalteromonas sp. NEC-BIFX-2020_002]